MGCVWVEGCWLDWMLLAGWNAVGLDVLFLWQDI